MKKAVRRDKRVRNARRIQRIAWLDRQIAELERLQAQLREQAAISTPAVHGASDK